MAAPFRLYNTLSRKVETFVPLRDGHVGLYVCGMTVYADAHVGHARAMVVFDTVRRYLRHRGWKVDFVRNFTDVDDKIIKRAAEQGEDPLALAMHFIRRFHDDVRGLRLVEPTSEPQVTSSIAEIVAMIQVLVDKGHAYAQDGSVWFSVPTCPTYGQLSNQKVDQLQNADSGHKRAPQDFALWKAAKPGEPAWDSPWGAGRPGWHIECSAMAKKQLGDTIDIHGGGLDLVFPHHENEIAQSECANGAPFARYWMHNGLLTMASGAKMGKSEGNAVQIGELLQIYPAEALRLYYLQNHYRSPLPWDENALPEALAMLARLYDAREMAESFGGGGDPDMTAGELGKEARDVLELGRTLPDRLHAAMDDDFNSAQALGHCFELARAINRFANGKSAKKRGAPIVAPALKAFRVLGASLGLLAQPTREFQDEIKQKRLGAMGIDRSTVENLLGARHDARAQKDWTRADDIRVQLDQLGIVVMDRADGVDWRVRLSAPEV